MWPHTYPEEQISRGPAPSARRALPSKTDPLAVLHADRDLHAEATLVSVGESDLQRSLRPLVRLGERDLDLVLDISADRGPSASSAGAPEQRPRVEVRLPLTEQRAEEVREAARFPVERIGAGLAGVDPLESARLVLRALVLKARPVRTEIGRASCRAREERSQVALLLFELVVQPKLGLESVS